VATSLIYYASSPSDGGQFTAAGIQRSEIRFIQVTFGGIVYLDPSQNYGLDLTKVNGYYGAPGGTLIHATVVSESVNPQTGWETVVYAFSGPGTEFGSLEDGNYNLQFFNQAIQAGGAGGPALATMVNQNFFRLFGDSNGDGKVDATDLNAFALASRSRKGFANYRSYFDFYNDGAVDAAAYAQFLKRNNHRLNADGTLTPLP
jgi:hypothetical protein